MSVLDPDLVVLSGSVATSAGDLILHPARQELARAHTLQAVLGPVPVVLGQTGPGAAALGAAELAASRRPGGIQAGAGFAPRKAAVMFISRNRTPE